MKDEHECDAMPDDYSVYVYGAVWVVSDGWEFVRGLAYCPFCGEKLPQPV